MRLQTIGAAVRRAAFLLLLLGAGVASAEDCVDSRPSGVALVEGVGQAHFHDDAYLCTGQKAYCLKRTYVIAGDRVLTSVSQDGYTCVFAPSRRDTTIGWIDAKRLRRLAIDASPPPSMWEGLWAMEDIAVLRIRHDQLGLLATGVDDWKSGDGYDENGGIGLPRREHHAEFSGRLRAAGNHARIKDRLCEVDVMLLDRFLVVLEDHNACGDSNTSFRGVYRRKL